MTNITIFTDGASRGNPGRGGWGAVVVYGDASDAVARVAELGGAENPTTNNRMELQAVIGALGSLSGTDGAPDADASTGHIKIYTDSSYVLKGATLWVSGWEKKGWKTATKQDVLNKDLWVELTRAMSGKKIEWHLVSGHVGVPGNERCDEIATSFADGETPALYFGPLNSYKINILEISANAEEKEKRSASKSRSRATAYSYISKVGREVMIHKTWAECEKRVKGAKGALYKKALTPAEEKAIVADFKGR
jgi:ribonuclease HI